MPPQTGQPYASAQSLLLEELLSVERLSTYVQECTGRLDDAVALYRWNTAITGAFWEDVGHLEVLMRNALDRRLSLRHTTAGRSGTWLDDPANELEPRALDDIAEARRRVRQNNKTMTHGQVVSELSFGFWRYLISNRYQVLWPDLAGAFSSAPTRNRRAVERPVIRLHVFRNRLAHHQRVWSEPLGALHTDLLTLGSWISPVAGTLLAIDSRVPTILAIRP